MPVIPLAKKEQKPWEWELNAESLSQYSLPPVVWSLHTLKKRVRKICFQHLSLSLFIVILHHYIHNSPGKEGPAKLTLTCSFVQGLCCTESRLLCVRQLILVEMHSFKKHQNRIGNSKLTLQLNTWWLCLIHKWCLIEILSHEDLSLHARLFLFFLENWYF